MMVRRQIAMLAFSAGALGCGGGDGGGGGTVTPPPPPPPTQQWPVVYKLAALPSPYMPGSVFTDPANCNRTRRSAIEEGTLTLQQGGSATVYLRAWKEEYTSINVPGIPCPSFYVKDLSETETGSYSISGTGSGRAVAVTLGGAAFANGAVSAATGFPSSLTLTVTESNMFGIGNPFGRLEGSTRWTLVP